MPSRSLLAVLLLAPVLALGMGAAPLACGPGETPQPPQDASPDVECAPGCLSCLDALTRQESVKSVDAGSLCEIAGSRFYWDTYRAGGCVDCSPMCLGPEGCAADTGKVSGACLACTKSECFVQRAKCASDLPHDGGC